jgi:hypothetical protein
MSKLDYTSPEVTVYGSIQSLTSAIGSASRTDQSEFPEQFPPDGGSFDVCDNNDDTGVC